MKSEKMTKSTVKREDLPYRPNVGIMLISDKKLIFAGKRLDQTVEGWQMPQGGIDKGEDASTAVLRELKEETGTDKAEIVRELDDWLIYDLPDNLIGVALHGRYRGQKQKWFALRFTGKDGDIDLASGTPEFSEWRWVTSAEMMDLIVPFKRDVYKKVLSAFADLIAA
jgi:putative (di)nucleoside polyphosphate hydrolase